MWRFPKLPFYARFGAIPESYLIALSYEEQLLWLCHAMSTFDEKIAKAFEDVKEYVEQALENLDIDLSKKQDKLTAGENITIDENNVISAVAMPVMYSYEDIINGSYYDIDKEIGSEISLTPIPEANTSHIFIEGVKFKDKFKVSGNYIAGIVDPQGNILLSKEEGYDSFECMQDGDLLVSWFNTDVQEPKISKYMTGNDIVERFEDDEYDIQNLKNSTTTLDRNVEGILNSYIEVSVSNGTNHSNYNLPNAANLPLKTFIILGNLKQDGTPSSLAPIMPEPVTGTHELKIADEYNHEVIFPIHLGDITLAGIGYNCDAIAYIRDSDTFHLQKCIGKIDSYNGETIETDYISSTGDLSIGATIYYVLPNDEWTDETITSTQLRSELYNILRTNIPRGDDYFVFDEDDDEIAKPYLSVVYRKVYYDVSTLVEDNDEELVTAGAVYRAVQSGNVEKINDDLVLLASGGITKGGVATTLTSGWKVLNASLYYHSVGLANVIYSNETLYYDATSKKFYGSLKSTYYDTEELDWLLTENETIETTLTNSRDKIPTSEAVYNAIQGSSPANFYTTINQDVHLAADGTADYTFEDEKYYYLAPGYKLYYIKHGGTQEEASHFRNSIFHYDGSSSAIYITRTDINPYESNTIERETLNWLQAGQYWSLLANSIEDYVRNNVTNSSVRTSIPASGNDTDVPSISAVRNYTGTMEDITSSITYTPNTGVTVAGFTAYKYNNFLLLNIQCTYSQTSDRVKDLLTINNYSGLLGLSGSGRTYDSPATTTVYGASCYISTTGKVTLFAAATHRGAILTAVIPMPTFTTP